MYTYRGASFAAGVVEKIENGSGYARGRLKVVTIIGYSLKDKSFARFKLNFWAERKIYGKIRDMTDILQKMKIQEGSHIIVKGITDSKDQYLINVDEIGYAGKKFKIENGIVGLGRVKGVYQTKNPEIIRLAIELDGKNYSEKNIVWLTVKNSVNPMGFVVRYKDSVQKHVHTDDLLMVVSSELKLYEGNGGMYIGGYLNGFYIIKDHLDKAG